MEDCLSHFDLDCVNAKIFEDKWRTSEMLWDLFHFFTLFWAPCIDNFKGIPLNVI